jgi:hypothetical protein
MSMVPYGSGEGGGLVEWGFELANTLLFYAYYLYDWLEVAPIIIKARLKQLGRHGVDQIPFISDHMKAEIKRWLRNSFGI